MNPPGIGLFALLREDLRTHDGNLFEQGFWAVAVHRFGNWRMGLPEAPADPLHAALPLPASSGSSGRAGSRCRTRSGSAGASGSGTTAG